MMKRYEVVSVAIMDEFPNLETNDLEKAKEMARHLYTHLTPREIRRGDTVEIRDYDGQTYDELFGWDGWTLVDWKEA